MNATATHDAFGREYARLQSLKPGDWIEDDGGFGCWDTHALHVVRQRADGYLYVDCDEGEHVLAGHVEDVREDDHCVGFYPAHALHLTDAQLKLARTAISVAFVDDDAPVYDHEDGFDEVAAIAAVFGIPHPRGDA